MIPTGNSTYITLFSLQSLLNTRILVLTEDLMNIVLILSALLFAALGTSLVVVIRRMSAAGRNLPLTAEWIDDVH